MPRFTSDRERRLWFRVLVVVVAIWSSLGLAGTLAETLRDRNLLDVAFFIGFLVTVGSIVTGTLQQRVTGREIWAGLSIAVAYAMIAVRMGIPLAERTHLFEYGLVAVLIYQALTERFRSGRKELASAALAVAMTALLGWLDEGIQALLPNRVYDLRDVGFNALAGLLAVAANLVLIWVRQQWGRTQRD